MAKANRIAANTRSIISEFNFVMLPRKTSLGMVRMLSKDIAQAVGTPCLRDKATSDEILRIVLVKGAIVMLASSLMA